MGGIKNKLSKLGKLSNKAKTLLHMPHSLSSKERADEMTQSSQSGEVNKVATLSIKPKSTLFYIVTSLVAIMLLTILAISIKLSFLRAASNEGANDTGAATLNSVSITKLGSTNSDGTSLTVTYSDGSTLSANKDNNEILNNDEVIYEASYNVTTPGTITLSFTMPANNVINEASVSEASGCMAGSKVEKADITNSDGTITKSYTNNKAVCIINPTTTGSLTWSVHTNPWGGNNERITPTVTISRQPQSTTASNTPIPTVTTIGRGDYGASVFVQAPEASTGGRNLDVRYAIRIYAHKSPITGVVGIAPLTGDGTWGINVDTSELPEDWSIYKVISNISFGVASAGESASVVNNGTAIAERVDSDNLRISWSGGVYGALHCPTKDSFDNPLSSPLACFYSEADITIGIPVDSLPVAPKSYSLKFADADATVIGGEHTVIKVSSTALTWTLSNRSYGNPIIWGGKTLTPNPGWPYMYSNSWPVYAGQQTLLGDWIQLNTVPSGNYATNLNYCTTFNPSNTRLISGFTKNDGYPSIIPSNSDYKVQYGIIGTDMSVLPSSSQQYCGKVGDENIPGQHMFFDTLEEANQYAKDNNLAVNAMRLWSDKVVSGSRDGRLGAFEAAPTGRGKNTTTIELNASGTTNEWDERSDGTGSDSPSVSTYRLTPGLLSHTLTAIPSSTNPGKEDHITISTKTYNKDTNTKITTTLPSGLSPKEGSFTITTGYDSTGDPIKEVLIEGTGQDYTITSNGSDAGSGTGGSSDGGYTITFDLDHIATTHHVPLTGYAPIYPGESGVTNIAWNSESSSWQEVITTNNNNEDSNLLNDDLPIAADNDGNGIDHAHTPIEFDLVVNEDAPVPSTLTINSTVTGTGTSYASTSFKTASDTIAIANPPATFGYDLTATPSNIYAGDSLTYNYSISNTTKDPASNITMVSVLPFNGDSRGTTGLKEVEENNPYTLTNLSLSLPGDGTASGLDTSTTKLYYTLDPKVRDLELTNPEALGTDPSITWQELALDSNGAIPPETMTELEDEGTSITALKLTSTTLPSGSKLNLEVTLDNILATTPGAQAKLASDITYLTYSTESNSINTQDANTPTILLSSDNYTVYSNGQTISTHQNPIATDYLGELLALSIPEGEQTIQVDLDLNDVVIGNPSISDNSTNPVNHLSLTTATLRGYTLTAQASTENGTLVAEGNPLRLIPSISTKPTKGTAGWSMSIAGSNNPIIGSLTSPTGSTTWTAIPGINQTPLNLYSSTTKGRDNRTLTITYGISAANTIADTYSARVVYTVAAEP